jgi:phosphoribosylformylglycinamidine cyclo-ligase
VTSYEEAGVDVQGAEEHVARILGDVTSTWSHDVVGDFGGFAAGVEIPDGYRHPVLMMSTDGVGTKLDIARRTGLWDGVGYDLVAMCIDDLAVVGSQPLGFVDYLAVGSLDSDRDARIVSSIAKACLTAGCALLGGETAEHPGVMEDDAVDLAGAAMGVVEKGAELGPHRVQSGDLIVGLHSPNLRSNGFSLVRSVFGDDVDEHADVLLEPSVIYTPSVLASIATGGVHAAAHITGGGLAHNLARSLPDGFAAHVDKSVWAVPEVFDLVAGYGVDPEEMYATFNMGIGFCLIVDPEGVEAVLASVDEHAPCVIGTVGVADGVRASD